ncbi:hypothetical protein FOXG_17567 [Fusarium oxysporum f. sp. lycopersici 4287]|uniref:Alpha/beta hydrolase fold-3 domain-containing protein n=3 Tax=Fusarium oxysporum TaxID=5507 RepID=A0A0J9WB25_FUSO4|nr:uncharacterized protein FOXG_17567 [Fusarium oxysporum f. sp. lycopersici 4287]EXK25356.1 hypothetical protein FOMG_17989 [Fusarium oxysporum f. sp. melonis 26406]KAJ9429882.1 Alpha/beta hydrolase fold-3 [Fusarium oxysporum]KNB20579.1 hypothetical protein FOXG_17567 [Fusarium oxysporum f. sp. lycopersici 4287]
MVLGDRFLGLNPFTLFIKECDAVIVTVEYRLAPEHKGMTLVEDCYTALLWVEEHLEEFYLDPQRLMIAGASAGGGLAAGTVLLSRDRGGPRLWGQMLMCPMLDDRNITVSAAQFERERAAYCTDQNRKAWACVLGDQVGKDGVSIYVAPDRATDLSRLPPTFVDVGGAEPFRDEAMAYALRLSQCGVLTDIHLWGGGCHGFEGIAPTAASSKAAAQAKSDWVHRVLGH